MKRYRVLVRGQNLLMSSGGSQKRLGFYTTTLVDAADHREASKIAIEVVRQSRQLTENLLNTAADPPLFVIDEIEETPAGDGAERKPLGLAFYEEARTIQ